MGHYGSARTFAVNPARIKARPCGLRGLTAQRGQARWLSCEEAPLWKGRVVTLVSGRVLGKALKLGVWGTAQKTLDSVELI